MAPPLASEPWIWNGLECHLPAGWDVTVLEKAYLRADDATGPRLEIVWRPGSMGGDMSPSTLRRRLEKRLPGATVRMEEPRLQGASRCLPFAWKGPGGARGDANAGEAGGAGEDGGRGCCLWPGLRSETKAGPVAIGKPARQAVLVLTHGEAAWDMVGPSLRLHPPDAPRPWHAFGLRAVPPQGYALESFHFRPGHFHVCCQGGPADRVTFDRLAPARLLLRNQSLEDWARTFYKSLRLPEEAREEMLMRVDACSLDGATHGALGESMSESKGESLGDSLEASFCLDWRPPPRWRWLPGRNRRRHRARVWLTDQGGKIMALLARGEAAADDALFETMCRLYVSTTPR